MPHQLLAPLAGPPADDDGGCADPVDDHQPSSGRATASVEDLGRDSGTALAALALGRCRAARVLPRGPGRGMLGSSSTYMQAGLDLPTPLTTHPAPAGLSTASLSRRWPAPVGSNSVLLNHPYSAALGRGRRHRPVPSKFHAAGPPLRIRAIYLFDMRGYQQLGSPSPPSASPLAH